MPKKPIPSCFIDFLVLWKGSSICLSFRFLLFQSVATRTTKSLIQLVLFFIINYHFRSSDRDEVIRLYLKIPENFVCLFLEDEFWLMHIPFQFLAQFPVVRLPYSVISYLILFLSLFTAFAFYVITRFASISIWPTLSMNASIFALRSPYYVVLCFYMKRFSFSLQVSLSYPCLCSRVRFRRFVAWNIHTVIFLQISVF